MSSDLFSRATKAMKRAKRKHEEAMVEFISQFISEIDQRVIKCAELGEWSMSIEIFQADCYKKMSKQNDYFPVLGTSGISQLSESGK